MVGPKEKLLQVGGTFSFKRLLVPSPQKSLDVLAHLHGPGRGCDQVPDDPTTAFAATAPLPGPWPWSFLCLFRPSFPPNPTPGCDLELSNLSWDSEAPKGMAGSCEGNNRERGDLLSVPLPLGTRHWASTSSPDTLALAVRGCLPPPHRQK